VEIPTNLEKEACSDLQSLHSIDPLLITGIVTIQIFSSIRSGPGRWLRNLLLVALAFPLVSCQSGKSGDRRVMTAAPTAGDATTVFRSVRLSQNMIPAGTHGRWKARPMNPRYITIHSTQNFDASADAAQHCLALRRGSLRGNNSLGYLTWHFTTDDNKSIQHLPANERGEHADFDGPGNRYSIGIEMCENRGSNRATTVDRTARLTAILMHAYDIPLRNVVPHYHWPRYKYKDNPHKNCPHFLLDNGRPGKTWKQYLARVDYYHKIVRQGSGGSGLMGGGNGGPNPKALQAYFERDSMVKRSFFAAN
jgi:N-acetylmuramoyl-L-alanine amidase